MTEAAELNGDTTAGPSRVPHHRGKGGNNDNASRGRSGVPTAGCGKPGNHLDSMQVGHDGGAGGGVVKTVAPHGSSY